MLVFRCVVDQSIFVMDVGVVVAVRRIYWTDEVWSCVCGLCWIGCGSCVDRHYYSCGHALFREDGYVMESWCWPSPPPLPPPTNRYCGYSGWCEGEDGWGYFIIILALWNNVVSGRHGRNCNRWKHYVSSVNGAMLLQLRRCPTKQRGSRL